MSVTATNSADIPSQKSSVRVTICSAVSMTVRWRVTTLSQPAAVSNVLSYSPDSRYVSPFQT